MKKDRFYKILAIVLLCAMLIFSCVGIFFIFKDCKNIKTAKADEQVVSFQSSRYFFTPSYDTSLSYTEDLDYKVFTGYTTNNFGYLSSTFYLDSTMDFVRLNMSYILSYKWQQFDDFDIPLIVYNNDKNYTVKSMPSIYGPMQDITTSFQYNYYTVPEKFNFCLRGNVNGSYRYTTYSFYAGYVDGFEVSKITSVREEISGVYGWIPQTSSITNGYRYSDLQSHDIYFYDSESRFFKFSIIEVLSYQNYLSDSNARYMDRNETIVLKNIFFSFESSDSYLQGKHDGYLEGITDKESYGTINYRNGYNAGYNNALNSVNDLTFFNLIASVVDVPIRAFTSLFDLNILGVNLTAFFVSILSLILVLKVIGLILGKL